MVVSEICESLLVRDFSADDVVQIKFLEQNRMIQIE